MPELYKGRIPIVRGDLNAGFLRGFDPDHIATGCVPRDYDVDPVLMGDSPNQMELIDPSEDDARFDEQEETKSSLEHLYLPGDGTKPAFQFLDQNGFPDCWVHSTFHAVMFGYLIAGLPVPRLNAVAAATMMRQTNGGWSGLSMKFAREQGCPLVGTGPGEWPFQSRNGQDTPELRANMAKFKAAEDWYDFGRQVYDQKLSSRQIVTSCFNNWPTPSDYNRHGHAMLTIRHVRIARGDWGRLTLNSWGGFGYHGLCVIAGYWPDSSVALRAVTPAIARSGVRETV